MLVRPHLTSRQTLGLVKEPQACLTLSGPRLKSCQVAKFAVALHWSQTAVLHTFCMGKTNFRSVEDTLLHLQWELTTCLSAVTGTMRIAHLKVQAAGPALVSSALACKNAGSQYTYASFKLNATDTDSAHWLQ